MSKASKKNTTAELESLRLPELQARFREVVGEISKSPNRKFLIRRIEETLAAQAEKVAPAEPAPEQPAVAASAPTAPAPEPEPVVAAVTPATKPVGVSATTEPVPNAAPVKLARGRFSALSVEELQAKYREVVGRPTGSENKAYLIWKIREAEKGRITVGPVQSRKSDGATSEADVKILPLRVETKVVEAMDAAWRERGIKNRMEFFRRALSHYLIRLGATEAAALFGSTASTEEGVAQ